ncbi:helix-turn-helix domain-containing protein, partial [Wenjunlia vitaminophila]|uniref:helix-turn-helix domain-containing protein n=1 Tax=Wenjunlia vitaminophila TaxID=76728 RepID=UPI000B0B5909
DHVVAEGDDVILFELTERTVALAGQVLAGLAPRRAASGAPATDAARRRLVDQARAALAQDWQVGLTELGRRLGCSPYHLSRTFRAVTGVTLSQYRTRLRVAAALERLLEGEPDLAALATDTGFYDQAHMSRVLRAETGLPPGRLRALLGRPGGR